MLKILLCKIGFGLSLLQATKLRWIQVLGNPKPGPSGFLLQSDICSEYVIKSHRLAKGFLYGTFKQLKYKSGGLDHGHLGLA